MTHYFIPFCPVKFQPLKLFEVDLLELKVEGLRIWGLSGWNKCILLARLEAVGENQGYEVNCVPTRFKSPNPQHLRM